MVIWVPSNLVNFAFVPQHFRVPFVALTWFAYTMVLSFMRGGQKRDVVVEEPVALEEAPVIEPLAAVGVRRRDAAEFAEKIPRPCALRSCRVVRTKKRVRWVFVFDRRGDGDARLDPVHKSMRLDSA